MACPSLHIHERISIWIKITWTIRVFPLPVCFQVMENNYCRSSPLFTSLVTFCRKVGRFFLIGKGKLTCLPQLLLSAGIVYFVLDVRRKFRELYSIWIFNWANKLQKGFCKPQLVWCPEACCYVVTYKVKMKNFFNLYND